MPEQINTSRVLLSTSEASERSGFSSRYIQRLLTEERIEGVKVGSVWLAYEDSLKAFIAQPRKRGPKGPRKKIVRS
jgi:excisionase family DNA binding protein